MGQGRSFSGHERNCVFLNTGKPSGETPRFADISAASGVDWPDDGRGVAVVDWDADGDLDMWISNRTAPRVRLMRNETADGHHFVALRLVGNGTDTNRDAIGARVQVFLSKEQDAPRLRTLRAGEGFVAQSSKWLHFGLGKEDQIAKVVVRWPSLRGLAGKTETFSGVIANRRFRLVQGRGEAEAVASRTDAIALKESVPKLPEPNKKTRAPSITLYRLPEVTFENPVTGEKFTTGKGKAVLLNLWGSWCGPCRKELKELAERADELREAGIEVVAFSVDALDKEDGDVEAAKSFIRQIRFPFTAQVASEAVIGLLKEYESLLITWNRPLPIPSSFLIDKNGHVAVIYKGSVGVDQLLEDVNLSRRSLKERWQTCSPLEGSLIEHEATDVTMRTQEATAMYRHGITHLKSNQLKEAAYHFAQAIKYREEFSDAHRQLGVIYSKKNEFPAAEQALKIAISHDPHSALAHYHLSLVYAQTGRIALAVTSLRDSIRSDADRAFERADLSSWLSQESKPPPLVHLIGLLESVHQQVAWLMATSPDENLRDGAQAIRWAKRLVESARRPQPGLLGTLAAGYAEQRRFEEATKTVKKAIGLVEQLVEPAVLMSPREEQLLAMLRSQLGHYEQGNPIRESPAAAD